MANGSVTTPVELGEGSFLVAPRTGGRLGHLLLERHVGGGSLEVRLRRLQVRFVEAGLLEVSTSEKVRVGRRQGRSSLATPILLEDGQLGQARAIRRIEATRTVVADGHLRRRKPPPAPNLRPHLDFAV